MRISTYLFIGFGVFFALSVQAGLEDIDYPIDALGGCENQEACFNYCEDPENFDACMAFAQENELLEEEQIEQYKTAESVLTQNSGPGGCADQASCETYCDEIVHMEECLAFARDNGMMSEEELAEASQVLTALQSGLTLPGGCSSEESCDAYCGDMAHMEECLSFGQAAGILSEEELSQAQQMLTILQTTGTPGGCLSQESCDAYCADEANVEECVSFAVEAGFMTSEEAQQVRERGTMEREEFIGPGGCTGEESCRAYCQLEEHREECGNFFGEEMNTEGQDEWGQPGAYEGFDEYQEYDPSSFIGPGGCVGEEACRAYCDDELNRDTCATFFGTSVDGEQEGSWETGGYPEEYPSEEEYQYEGSENYELYEEHGYGSDPGTGLDSFGGEEGIQIYLEEGEPGIPYEEMYVEPPSQEFEFPSIDTFEAPAGESMNEPLTTNNSEAGFVESTRLFLGEVLIHAREFLSI